MKNNIFSIIIFSIFFLCSNIVSAGNVHKIKVLVEDSPITAFHIRQRTNLHLMSSRELTKRLRAKLKAKSTQTRWRAYIKKSRPTSKAEVAALQKKFVRRLQNEARNGLSSNLKKKVLEELINERLQINTAKKLNIIISNTTLDGQIERIAKRNNKKASAASATKAFYASLKSRGVGRSTFREKIRASLAWQQVIRRKFGREVSFTDRDVEKKLGLNNQENRNKKVQLRLIKIIIAIESHKDQSKVVQQYLDADKIRHRYSNCSNMKSLLAPYKNASFVSLGKKTLDQLPSPIDIILSDMKTGQISPPQPTAKGIEMYAVCDRRNVMMDDTKRTKVLSELRKNAYEMRANRYLKDLRQDAHIEYRN